MPSLQVRQVVEVGSGAAQRADRSLERATAEVANKLALVRLEADEALTRSNDTAETLTVVNSKLNDIRLAIDASLMALGPQVTASLVSMIEDCGAMISKAADAQTRMANAQKADRNATTDYTESLKNQIGGLQSILGQQVKAIQEVAGQTDHLDYLLCWCRSVVLRVMAERLRWQQTTGGVPLHEARAGDDAASFVQRCRMALQKLEEPSTLVRTSIDTVDAVSDRFFARVESKRPEAYVSTKEEIGLLRELLNVTLSTSEKDFLPVEAPKEACTRTQLAAIHREVKTIGNMTRALKSEFLNEMNKTQEVHDSYSGRLDSQLLSFQKSQRLLQKQWETERDAHDALLKSIAPRKVDNMTQTSDFATGLMKAVSESAFAGSFSMTRPGFDSSAAKPTPEVLRQLAKKIGSAAAGEEDADNKHYQDDDDEDSYNFFQNTPGQAAAGDDSESNNETNNNNTNDNNNNKHPIGSSSTTTAAGTSSSRHQHVPQKPHGKKPSTTATMGTMGKPPSHHPSSSSSSSHHHHQPPKDSYQHHLLQQLGNNNNKKHPQHSTFGSAARPDIFRKPNYVSGSSSSSSSSPNNKKKDPKHTKIEHEGQTWKWVPDTEAIVEALHKAAEKQKEGLQKKEDHECEKLQKEKSGDGSGDNSENKKVTTTGKEETTKTGEAEKEGGEEGTKKKKRKKTGEKKKITKKVTKKIKKKKGAGEEGEEVEVEVDEEVDEEVEVDEEEDEEDEEEEEEQQGENENDDDDLDNRVENILKKLLNAGAVSEKKKASSLAKLERQKNKNKEKELVVDIIQTTEKENQSSSSVVTGGRPTEGGKSASNSNVIVSNWGSWKSTASSASVSAAASGSGSLPPPPPPLPSLDLSWVQNFVDIANRKGLVISPETLVQEFVAAGVHVPPSFLPQQEPTQSEKEKQQQQQQGEKEKQQQGQNTTTSTAAASSSQQQETENEKNEQQEQQQEKPKVEGQQENNQQGEEEGDKKNELNVSASGSATAASAGGTLSQQDQQHLQQLIKAGKLLPLDPTSASASASLSTTSTVGTGVGTGLSASGTSMKIGNQHQYHPPQQFGDNNNSVPLQVVPVPPSGFEVPQALISAIQAHHASHSARSLGVQYTSRRLAAGGGMEIELPVIDIGKTLETISDTTKETTMKMLARRTERQNKLADSTSLRLRDAQSMVVDLEKKSDVLVNRYVMHSEKKRKERSRSPLVENDGNNNKAQTARVGRSGFGVGVGSGESASMEDLMLMGEAARKQLDEESKKDPVSRVGKEGAPRGLGALPKGSRLRRQD